MTTAQACPGNEIKGLNGLQTSIEDILKNIDKLGGPESEPHYPVGWAWVGNTPFQWIKQVASHLGGTRNPMAISWPAKVTTEGEKTEGVIMGFGGVAAGIVFYLDDGVPVFDYNSLEEHTVVKADNPLPLGESTVEVDFDFSDGGAGKVAKITLKVDGQTVATGEMEATVAARFGIGTFGIGEDSGQPVTFDYKPPFKVTGEIVQVKIEMSRIGSRLNSQEGGCCFIKEVSTI